MTTKAIRGDITEALAAVPGADWPAGAAAVLSAMDYRSELVLEGQTGDPSDFIRQFPADNPGTQTEQRFLDAARSAQVLFQTTNSEISEGAAPSQRMMFDTGNAQSFLFFAVELRDDSYPRGRYAEFTREINKRLAAPAVVLFRTASNRVTLAFVHRRPNRRNPERDVLGSVSLIREIDPADQHQAHVRILEDLTLPARLKWMAANGRPANFDGLLAAWLNALDTEELNRRFYDDLFKWFERAVKDAKFPKREAKIRLAEEHVIRLITRLMFVWFIKEKGLVHGDLFIENKVRQLLKGYDLAGGDSYYRAVLQNLFFATLNTEIGQRRFSRKSHDDHRNFSVYRYEDEIGRPDELRELFDRTPFINGGLFDCLDSLDATGAGGIRVDCFTDNPAHRAGYSIPNRLFFDDGGLITLFNRYKFTVEENTPAEQEVALDPELLGKVFENLLAAFNPETRENARKQTGSYYTPRAVVDYMVDEALVAAVVQRTTPAEGDVDYWQERLRFLLDYGDADAGELFTPAERETVVRAIAQLKALDPAVGSGAFPMGILHKLTLALRRLDPGNELWERVQRDEAANRSASAYRNVGDDQQRQEALAEIENTFRRYRDSDFGRKLYLIQNSIYGVDIQPVATQIAKLRFFISLAIEQQPNGDTTDNYGIRPLPNLETRFVAADTLMPLRGQQGMLTSQRVEELLDALQANRERHFHSNTRSLKLRYRDLDTELRGQLANELRQLGLQPDDANKVAAWDPYDQNAPAAGWFDSYYMFDVRDGFDIVIGNPPYHQIRKGTYPADRFPFSEGRDKGKQNLYKLFVEQSYNLCKNGSVATLIVQSSLMCDLSSAATRQLLLERTQLRHVIEFPKAASTRQAQVFQSVTQGTCIYQFIKSQPDSQPIMISVGNDAHTIADLRFASITRGTIENLYPSLRCLPRIGTGSVGILEKIAGNNAIKPLRDHAASIVQGDLNLTTHSRRFSSKPSKVRLLRGRHVGRFVVKYDTSDEYCDQNFMPEQVKANREGVFLICQQITGTNDERRLHFGVTENPATDFLCGNSLNKLLLKNPSHSKAVVALLNSNFMDWFFRITSTNNHVQGYELEQLPIPAMTAADRRRLSGLANRVIEAKAADPDSDTTADEEEIDRLVYALYGLTEGEETTVERSLGLIHQTDEEEDAALFRAMEEADIDDPDDFASEAEVMATLRSLRDSHGN